MDYKSIVYEKVDGIATITKVNKDMDDSERIGRDASGFGRCGRR